LRVPIGEWFRSSLREMLRDTLLADGTFISTVLDVDAIEDMIEAHEAGRVDYASSSMPC